MTTILKNTAGMRVTKSNQYTAELHLQMIKYADELKNITAKEFCEGVGLRSSFGTEFSKMRNLTQRLKAAGLDTAKL